MYGEQVQISDAFFISFFSITVVFIVLLLISYMTDIVAFFVNKKSKATKVVESNTNIESKSNLSGVDTKVVTAITAAICMIDGKSPNNIIIKSIKRVPKWK